MTEVSAGVAGAFLTICVLLGIIVSQIGCVIKVLKEIRDK